MVVVYSFLIAAALASALIGIPHLIDGHVRRREQREMFSKFAHLKCPECESEFGPAAIDNGVDTSPWEELWSDGADHSIHCHPVCRVATCPQCCVDFEIRFQTQGEFFGPELSVRSPEP